MTHTFSYTAGEVAGVLSISGTVQRSACASMSDQMARSVHCPFPVTLFSPLVPVESLDIRLRNAVFSMAPQVRRTICLERIAGVPEVEDALSESVPLPAGAS